MQGVSKTHRLQNVERREGRVCSGCLPTGHCRYINLYLTGLYWVSITHRVKAATRANTPLKDLKELDVGEGCARLECCA